LPSFLQLLQLKLSRTKEVKTNTKAVFFINSYRGIKKKLSQKVSSGIKIFLPSRTPNLPKGDSPIGVLNAPLGVWGCDGQIKKTLFKRFILIHLSTYEIFSKS